MEGPTSQPARPPSYAPYSKWTDRGILHDLGELYHHAAPTQPLLLNIALVLSKHCGIPLDRNEKRNRDNLIGWINYHYDSFGPLIPRLLIRDTTGAPMGSEHTKAAWADLQARDPEHPAVEMIRNAGGS
jgi:hypothetical protein